MNLPVSAIAMTLVFFFLNLKSPRDNMLEKLGRVDWIGNVIIVGSTTSLLLGLTW